MEARLRGHKQRKLNGHVYSFLLFVSSRPHYQADRILIYRKWPIVTLHVFNFQDEDIPGNYNLFNMEEKSDRNGEVIFASIYNHNWLSDSIL